MYQRKNAEKEELKAISTYNLLFAQIRNPHLNADTSSLSSSSSGRAGLHHFQHFASLIQGQTSSRLTEMIDEFKDPKAMETKVERYEVVSDGETGFVKPVQEPAAMGTVTITDLNELFLIPAPSADPRGQYSATRSQSSGALIAPIRPIEPFQISQSCLHRFGFDLLELGPCTGVRFRRSPHLVYSCLCGGWCHLRRYHCADDVSFNVHGCRQSGLHASCSGDWQAARLPLVAADTDCLCSLGCLCERLQCTPWCQDAFGICCWSERGVGTYDDSGMNIDIYAREIWTYWCLGDPFRTRA